MTLNGKVLSWHELEDGGGSATKNNPFGIAMELRDRAGLEPNSYRDPDSEDDEGGVSWRPASAPANVASKFPRAVSQLTCRKCGFRAKSKIGLGVHARRAHRSKPSPWAEDRATGPIKCRHCGVVKHNSRAMRYHLFEAPLPCTAETPGGGILRQECPGCGKIYQRARCFRRHLERTKCGRAGASPGEKDAPAVEDSGEKDAPPAVPDAPPAFLAELGPAPPRAVVARQLPDLSNGVLVEERRGAHCTIYSVLVPL